MDRFLSLAVSVGTVIEHRPGLIMLSTKIDSIRTQTFPAATPLWQRAPRWLIRTLSVGCCNHGEHNQYAKSRVQGLEPGRTSLHDT